MEKWDNTSAEDWRQCFRRRIGGQSWEPSWVWKPENNGGIKWAAVWFSLVAFSSWGIFTVIQPSFPFMQHRHTIWWVSKNTATEMFRMLTKQRLSSALSTRWLWNTFCCVRSPRAVLCTQTSLTVSQQTATYPCC